MFINCHSYYSFKYGTMSIETLIAEALRVRADAIALTDINSTAGIFPFLQQAQRHNVHAVVGIDFRDGSRPRYIGLAKNQEGLYELNKHLSEVLAAGGPFPQRAPAFSHACIVYPLQQAPDVLREEEFVGVRIAEIRQLYSLRKRFPVEKLVLWQPVSFQDTISFNTHRLLRAIDRNSLLSKLPLSEQGQPDDRFYTYAELAAQCEGHSYLITAARKLLEQCQFSFYFHAVKNKRNVRGSSWEDFDYLRTETLRGAVSRYPKLSQEIFDRIEKELLLIQQKDFVSYFLINYDIVRYAHRKGYFHVGRGSGANSIVAYCLYITDVDPIALDLYFERFINLYRDSPPDFDIDFSWKDRDDVIRYIFETYKEGDRAHVALLSAHSTFQYQAVTRELGKVFGLPTSEIEQLLAKGGPKHPLDQYGRLIKRYGQRLIDVPSHLSIHAGGVLISEKPIHYYSATTIPPKGFPITHFDMHVAEAIGLHKFDILSQRGLGHIKTAMELIHENQGVEVDIRQVERFKEDEKIKELLRTGKTMGAFYVESPAMRMLLSKMKAQTYLELVAASSIIRPGVARSGMMRAYILRHLDAEKRKEAHPVMESIMPDTYGIMVYQEDVIKVAHYFAELSLGEADILRRGMSGKSRSKEEFQRVKDAFFSNCERLGREKEITEQVWHQIESFAGYSFAKGHSASFAVESYQSLYLKAYFPLEFMVAVINNFGGFYHTEFYLHELRMQGAEIEAPDVNESRYLTHIQGTRVLLGFIHLKHFEKKSTEWLLRARAKGPFTSLEDFMLRVPLGIEQLRILIRIEAFRFTGRSKAQLLWIAHARHQELQQRAQAAENSLGLFPAEVKPFRLEELPPLSTSEDWEKIHDQLEILEFPLDSPFLLVESLPVGTCMARDLPKQNGKWVTLVGYLVTVKPTRTVKGERMHFGTFLDQEGNWVDTVHFPDKKNPYPFRGKGVYYLKGRVSEEFGFYTVEVAQITRLPYKQSS
ncbi:DNA polymerase III subunit alpha [Nitritalea halalkaliphila]|nr:PHP domain-containing protein [Nitritalea halalkaliphila]